MIKSSDISAALVTQLRAIPALVTALGNSAANIYVKDEYEPLLDAQWGQPDGTLMVVYQYTIPGGLGSMEVYQHTFSLFLQYQADPSAILALVLDAVPTGAGNKMRELSLVAGLLPFGTASIFRRQFAISDKQAKDFWEIQLSFPDRGI
jgi:hypothetical protein